MRARAFLRPLAVAAVPTIAIATMVIRPAAASTSAAPSCTFDGHTATATYGDPRTYGISASFYQVPSKGGELAFDQDGAVDCGATIDTAAAVVVNGTPTLDFFTVDESQSDFSGQLPPIDARLGGGNDVLIGLGISNQVNTMVFGSNAMVINGTVVTYSAIARGELHGGNKNGDLLSAQGGGPAGGVFHRVVVAVAGKGAATIEGGNGPDILKGDSGSRGDSITGGRGQDAIQGSEGDDQISGGPGGDNISGDSGDDVVRGQGGDDFVMGDAGMDRLMGGSGSDEFRTQDGERDAINGGSGTDIASVDCGLDVVTKVETVTC
jgi:Ca2+-binding RTX toxin-like protein